METTCLVVDNRESRLKDLLEKLCYTEQLSLGDVIIKVNEEDFIVFERKTLSDLASSIIDGRYSEQKQRLLANYQPSNVYYIIEGNFDFLPSDKLHDVSLPKKTIISCIINTIIRDHIQIFLTKNVQETAELIKEVYQRIQKDPSVYINEEHCTSNNISLKAKKIFNRYECYIAQLCQIPNVSTKSASAIADTYPSFDCLLDAFKEKEESEKLKLLKELCLTDKKGKTRKISEKVAKNIITYLL